MKLDNRPADPLGKVDPVVIRADFPTVASPTPWHKQLGAPSRAAAMLALVAGLLAAPFEQLRTSRSDSSRLRSGPARTSAECSRLRSSSRRAIRPTSTPVTRAPLTSSFTSSLVHTRQIHLIPARALRLRAALNDDVDREHYVPGGPGSDARAIYQKVAAGGPY